MNRSLLLLPLLFSALPYSPIAAQSGSPVAGLTAEVRSVVVDSIVGELGRTYVDADTGRLIGDRIRTRHRGGAYDRLGNPAQFADAVTTDLRSLNGDLHLGLRYAPPGANRPAGGPQADFAANARRLNFGLGRAAILDGNVGYLEITGFMGVPGYQEAVVDALRFLSRTDALLIDLRRNGGGSSEMSHFLFSHFLGAVPVPTIDVRRRGSSEPARRKSLAEVPGPRRPEVPLFLLTSQGTASAAEEFSFVLKNQRRVTIVGTRTAGAGHMVNGLPVGHGFVLSLSITRVSDPVTGKEWEQVGVQPDASVAPDLALTKGHELALAAILGKTEDPDRVRVLTRLKAVLAAQSGAGVPSTSLLAGFAGSYEGRVVAVANGRLRYTRRAGGLSEELVWLSGNRFALGATQFVFETKDGTVRLTIEQADGTQVTFVRGAGGGG